MVPGHLGSQLISPQANAIIRQQSNQQSMQGIPCRVPLPLSDKTQIANTTWGRLKLDAQQPNHEHQQWYIKMSLEDKELFQALMNAQQCQGDWEELRVQPQFGSESTNKQLAIFRGPD